jgi:stage II sporulation protein D
MLYTAVVAYAATTGDAGGRDLSVALFSTQTLHSVTLTPLTANAWIAHCARCAHAPFSAPLKIDAPQEIVAGGTLRLVDNTSGEARTATGLWRLRAIGQAPTIDIVLTIPSERYVAAVLNAEAAPGEPRESLRALAILARTYALNGTHFIPQLGHLAANLCDSTECQAMLPGPDSPAIEEATRATAGETLWFRDRRAQVFYSQSCGGLTEDAGAVWPRLSGLPYLRSHPDPYCLRRGQSAWHDEITLSQLAAIARAEAWHIPANVRSARIVDRSRSHRALHIEFANGNGERSVVSASALRFAIGRALGWNRVRSDAYEIAVRNEALIFDGRGDGHGVGLCQQGATQMASEGKSAREILAFYFPGTSVRVSASDEGWRDTRSNQLTIRATGRISPQRIADMDRIWMQAQRRFPSRRVIAPQIVFAPTTELFRQMTTQPGWDLASTRGSTVVLQQQAVLGEHGADAEQTLLHEFLHVLVEDEASAGAPLWLREGLVEVLAGDRPADPRTTTTTAMESALAHPQSRQQSQQAHRAAAVRVRDLINRYGLSAVRGWLSAGVPPGGV